MAGKDGVEAGGDNCCGARAPAKSAQIAVHDAGVLNDAQVRAQRQFLKHTAHAATARDADAVGRKPAAITKNLALLRGKAAIDHRDDGGFSGTIMADKADAFAGQNRQRHTIQGAHFAKAHRSVGDFQQGGGLR